MFPIPAAASIFYSSWTHGPRPLPALTSGLREPGETWFAITDPRWNGSLPENVIRYHAPTDIVWLLGRTQTNGASDYDIVRAFQRGMRIMPLSAYPDGEQKFGSALAFGAASGGTPPERIKAMEPEAFFSASAAALKANPPHVDDIPGFATSPGLASFPEKISMLRSWQPISARREEKSDRTKRSVKSP
jgi:hypothetical protein